MPTICSFRGIKIYINWNDHQPPHFHAVYGEDSVMVSIATAEVLHGSMPGKQLKLVQAWAVMRRDLLEDDWELAKRRKELFPIDPLQ